MADFCKQCSLENFDKDFQELAWGDSDHYDLCESCGYVLVDMYGKCIDPVCGLHGDKESIGQRGNYGL